MPFHQSATCSAKRGRKGEEAGRSRRLETPRFGMSVAGNPIDMSCIGSAPSPPHPNPPFREPYQKQRGLQPPARQEQDADLVLELLAPAKESIELLGVQSQPPICGIRRGARVSRLSPQLWPPGRQDPFDRQSAADSCSGHPRLAGVKLGWSCDTRPTGRLCRRCDQRCGRLRWLLLLLLVIT